MKIEASVNQDEIRLDESLIYTFNILNQSDKDMRNIIFNPYVINELSFVGGSVKRQRGVMDIEKEYINLEIGNLAPKENATIIIELKLSDNFKATTDNLFIEIKCYGIVIFSNHKNTKRTITSNIVDTKITGHTF